MNSYLLPELLSASAMRLPDRPAVIDAHTRLTYEQLDTLTNRIAHLLREAGVRAGDRVGVFLPKSVNAIAGLYGIMKAGAAYVPLDPLAPASRVAYIARNCGLRCLITGREKAGVWNSMLDQGAPIDRFVMLDASASDVAPPRSGAVLGHEVLAAMPETAPATSTIDLDLAYVLYTSGSTGQPKGVMLSHLNAMTFIRWCHRYFAPCELDVFSNHAPLHFDLTILDLFVAAMAGASVVAVPSEISVFPRQVAEFIERHRITIWYSVPSVLSMLALHGTLTVGRLASLRHVIFAGDVFPTAHLRALMRILPSAEFTNLYGPTETNVCTYYRVPLLSDAHVAPIPIGRAIENVEVFAVTEKGVRAEPGEAGELYVRGATVAYGYWGDRERTAVAFGTDPTGPALDRVYRTGDLVRQTEDGEYLFLGRRDHQIKSRGFRIELGDIEAALYAHPAVVECVVLALPDEMIGTRLKAFVVCGDHATTEGELARFCATLLPKYMIPEQFEFMDALPKTSTGKLDRNALGAARVPA